MRFLSILILLLFLTGCAYNKMRLVRTDRHQEVLTETVQERKTEKITEENEIASNEIPFEKPSSASEISVERDQEIDDFEEIENISESYSNPADTIRVDSDEYKVAKAKEAEELAVKARNLFIVTLILLFIPIVNIFALIPFIIGSVKISKAKKSQYITKYGQSQQKLATVLQWVYAGILILSILIVTVALLILLL